MCSFFLVTLGIKASLNFKCSLVCCGIKERRHIVKKKNGRFSFLVKECFCVDNGNLLPMDHRKIYLTLEL